MHCRPENLNSRCPVAHKIRKVVPLLSTNRCMQCWCDVIQLINKFIAWIFSISQSQKNIARFLAHLTEISQRISQKYRPNIRVFGRFHENFKPNVGKYLKKLCFDDDIQVKIWETRDIAKVFKKSGQKLVKFGTLFSGNLKLTTLLCFKNIL